MQVVVVLQVEPERRRCSERLAQPQRAVGANSDTLLHDALDARARDTQPLGERACGQIERLQKLLAQDLTPGCRSASFLVIECYVSTDDTISKELPSQRVIQHAGGGPASNGRIPMRAAFVWPWVSPYRIERRRKCQHQTNSIPVDVELSALASASLPFMAGSGSRSAWPEKMGLLLKGGRQQVTWNRPIFFPSASLKAQIACGVG